LRRLVLMATVGAFAAIMTGCEDDPRVSGDPSTPATRVAEPAPAEHDIATLGPAPNGWVAVDGYRGGEIGISLVRPGEKARRLKVAGLAGGSAGCPAWSPDGTRLLFGRVTGSSQIGRSAELVIVPVGSNGATGAPKLIALDGFQAFDARLDAHPCGTWSPDGRWIALAGTGAVWVVNTKTGAIRRLPGLRPNDLEWRPGTDELAIATLSTPITIYSTATGVLSRLGDVRAANITWSPDGKTLAYTSGEYDAEALSLWLVDADGTNNRLLFHDRGSANHGIGPVWSPTGDRIAYQRVIPDGGERHEVVLVNVADGTETTITPPVTNGSKHWHWWPYAVWWSPDGTTLLYEAYIDVGSGPAAGDGLIAVPADQPNHATVLISRIGVPNIYNHQWAPIQMWGRQPE
jgi:dipeptidyl aminopeptidase/acylaminoacyl peptidase